MIKFGVKTKPGEELLAVLQGTVRTVLRQWLDENKAEVLLVVREAALQNEAAHGEHSRESVNQKKFLTVAEVARRWRLHPESVRRMIRQGRVPRVILGRHNRVALGAIEALEKAASVSNPFPGK